MLGCLAVLGRLALEWRASHSLLPGGRGTGVLAAQDTAVFHFMLSLVIPSLLQCSHCPQTLFRSSVIRRMNSNPNMRSPKWL